MTITTTDVPTTDVPPPKEEEVKVDEDEICSAADHHDKFDPTEYLESFYKTASEDTAMQIVLFFLPGILYRLPTDIRSVLDLGAGPTVYLPIALRDRAQTIYTSDYAPANRNTLQSWIENKASFDWTNVCKWIANIEASKETPLEMQEKARQKMQAVFEVNVQEDPVIKSVQWQRDPSAELPKKFQLVTTVFCLEYSTETLEGYNRAMRSACSLIEDNGYFIEGGVLDATSYNFGGKCFKSHRLHKSHIIEALKLNGMSTDEKQGFKFITHDDIFLLVSKKIVKS